MLGLSSLLAEHFLDEHKENALERALEKRGIPLDYCQVRSWGLKNDHDIQPLLVDRNPRRGEEDLSYSTCFCFRFDGFVISATGGIESEDQIFARLQSSLLEFLRKDGLGCTHMQRLWVDQFEYSLADHTGYTLDPALVDEIVQCIEAINLSMQTPALSAVKSGPRL